LRYDRECDQRHYNLPSAASNEIAVILPGDGDEVQGSISRVTSVLRLKAIWDGRSATATTKNIVYPEVIID
jgi:hypothetical protein